MGWNHTILNVSPQITYFEEKKKFQLSGIISVLKDSIVCCITQIFYMVYNNCLIYCNG